MKTYRANGLAGGVETVIHAGLGRFGTLGRLLFLSAVILLAGCATANRFKVEAERAAEPVRGTTPYRLVVRSVGEPTDSNVLAHAAADVRTALADKGLEEAPANARVDTFVVVDVGILPAHPVTIAEPDPFSEGLAWPTSGVVVLDPRSTTRYNEDGVPLNLTTKISRNKILRVTACERALESGRTIARILWRVDVTNDDESVALDSSVPLMVVAAMDSLIPAGKRSAIVEISVSDRRLAFLRKQK